jgi:DNA-binding SARP family transcriptional activator
MISSLRISLLGDVSFQLNDKPLARLTAVKAQALLSYLAVTARPHTRAALDVLETAAHTSLRVTLVQLRQAVGDYLDATRQTVALATEHPIWLDITEFVQACSRLQSAAASIEESTFLRNGWWQNEPTMGGWRWMRWRGWGHLPCNGVRSPQASRMCSAP